VRHLNEIFVHCTATRPEWMKGSETLNKVEEIKRWHLDRGWSDIGYHYLIDRDGTIADGRPIERAGAHVKGYNKHSVGISLFGGYGGNEDDKFEDHFTVEQDHALRYLISELESEYPSIKKIRGHNEVAAKACPCFQVMNWFNTSEKNKKPRRKSISQSKTIQASAVAKVVAVVTPLVAVLGELPWKNLLIVLVLAVVGLIALGIIDIERFKKWNKGDR